MQLPWTMSLYPPKMENNMLPQQNDEKGFYAIKKTGTEIFSPVLFYSAAGPGCRQPAAEMIFCGVLPSRNRNGV